MKKYKFTASIIATNLEKYLEIFKEQIDLRPDFVDPDVFLDTQDNLTIEAQVDAFNEDEAEKLTSTILWELCSAVLKDSPNYDVEVERVEEMKKE